ncbi:hypothetical protein [Scytonema hofmannii]|nr:hypothetical protein [Scytonema hofmannii]
MTTQSVDRPLAEASEAGAPPSALPDVQKKPQHLITALRYEEYGG